MAPRRDRRRRHWALLAAASAVAVAALFLAGLPGDPNDVSTVPQRTTSGAAELWRAPSVTLTLDTDEDGGLPSGTTRAALAQAAAAWSGQLQGCGAPAIVVADASVAGHDVGYDGVNLVIWRRRGYCADRSHAGDAVCAAPLSTAVTTLFFVDRPGSADDGELLEADVELNGDHWSFASDGSADAIDLPSTLTHELGHVFGLDHTCVTQPPPHIDLSNVPTPSCTPLALLPARVTDAVMFNFQNLGDVTRRVPSRAEALNLCHDYASTDAASLGNAAGGPANAPQPSAHGCDFSR